MKLEPVDKQETHPEKTMSYNNMEAQPRQMNHYNPRPPKPRTSSSSSQGYEGNFQGGRANFEPGYQGTGMAGGYGGGGGQQHNHHPQFPQQQQFPPQQMFQNQFVPGQGYPPGMMGGMMPQQVYFVSNPAVPVYAQYGNQQPRMAYFNPQHPQQQMMVNAGGNAQGMSGMVAQGAAGPPGAPYQQPGGPGPQASQAAQQPPQPATVAPTGAIGAPQTGQTPADAMPMTGAQGMQKKYNNDPLWTPPPQFGMPQTPAAVEASKLPPAQPKKKSILVFTNPDTNKPVDIPVAENEPKVHNNPAGVSRENSGPRLSESDSGAASGNDVRNEFQRKVAELTRPGPGTSKEVSATSSRASPALSLTSETGTQNGVSAEGIRKISIQSPGETMLGERKPSVHTETKTEVGSSPEKDEMAAPVIDVPPSSHSPSSQEPAPEADPRPPTIEPTTVSSPPVPLPSTSPQQPPAASQEDVKQADEENDRFVDGAQSPTENGEEREESDRRRHSVADPSNARIVYSRDAMLQIEQRGHTFSHEVALRLNDIIKSGTPGSGGGGGGLRPNQVPYDRQRSRHSDYGPPRGPGGNITPKMIHITLTPQEVIPTSENAWKPSVKGHKVLDENEKVLVDVRALLNKLTPSNYVKLMQRMVEGQIPFHETPERLQATVGLIFDKALEEPNYAEFYAKMCRDLIKTEAKDAKGDVVKFRTVLLQQTQRYFEKTQKEEEEAELEKNEEDPEALQEKRAKAKRHYLGNIRFISELYKVEMLTDRVILSCFQKLLPKKSNSEDADEEKLECLCKLLQTCAKMIKEQNTVDIIFGQLKKMIDANVSSSRIRFMMEDTIDLKNNNYVPRKIVSAKPTTIQEVHAAKQKEEQEIRQSVADHGPVQLPRHVQMPPRGGMPGGRGGMMPQGGGRGLSKPNSVPSGLSNMGGGVPPRHGGRPVLPQMETGKKKLMGLLNSHDGGGAPMLGPQRAQWGAGSGAGMHKNPVAARPPENKSASSSRESSMNRLNNPRGSLTHTPTFPDEERSGTPLASGTATPSQIAGTPSRSPVQEDVELEAEAVDEFVVTTVTRALNSEGEDSRDVINESVRTIRRWTGPTKASFIKSILGRSFDAKSNERVRYPEFLMSLAREGLFPEETLADGLGRIVEETDDIAVDVPSMYDYVVDLVGPLVVDGFLGPAALDSALSKSPDHVPKYHGAFRKWLEAHVSPQQKDELISREPVLWQKILGSA